MKKLFLLFLPIILFNCCHSDQKKSSGKEPLLFEETLSYHDECPHKDLEENGPVAEIVEYEYQFATSKANSKYIKQIEGEGYYVNPHDDLIEPYFRRIKQYNKYGCKTDESFEFANGSYSYQYITYNAQYDCKKNHCFSDMAGFSGDEYTYYSNNMPIKSIRRGNYRDLVDYVTPTNDIKIFFYNEDSTQLLASKRFDYNYAQIEERYYDTDSVTIYRFHEGLINDTIRTSKVMDWGDDSLSIRNEYTYDEYQNWVTSTHYYNDTVTNIRFRLITYYK